MIKTVNPLYHMCFIIKSEFLKFFLHTRNKARSGNAKTWMLQPSVKSIKIRIFLLLFFFEQNAFWYFFWYWFFGWFFDWFVFHSTEKLAENDWCNITILLMIWMGTVSINKINWGYRRGWVTLVKVSFFEEKEERTECPILSWHPIFDIPIFIIGYRANPFTWSPLLWCRS